MVGQDDDLKIEPPPRADHRRTAPAQPEHDVFVSYSAHDKPLADAIVARLEQAGIRCWVAPRDILPGMIYAEALVRAIEGARVMVLVWSRAANQSPQVLREVERAVHQDLFIVPFRTQLIEPTAALSYFLSTPH